MDWTIGLMIFLSVQQPTKTSSLEIEGTKLTVQTPTVQAIFEGAALTSLKSVSQSIEFIDPEAPEHPAVDVQFLDHQTLGSDKHQAISVQRLAPLAARVTITGADSERSLLITIDEATGDIRLTPNGLTNRRGVRSVSWQLPIHPEATIVLPVVNGLEVRSKAAHPPTGRFPWPFKWEAQLVIVERDGVSMMVHSEDRMCRFKALQLTRSERHTRLGFESEPVGPLWQNRGAGGIEWRLNVYDGDWKRPATRYRDWMSETYNLPARRQNRPKWVGRITLAACWVRADETFLDALAEAHPPEQTLIHLSHDWRDDKYDLNYPDYNPNEKGIRFAAKARQMGFHIMPHFNFWAVYEDHPFFQQVRDFQVRSVDQNKPEGWYWPPDTHDYTRMAYIHPGLGLWRHKLIDVTLGTCEKLLTDAAFIDQTLCTYNTDNGLVEGMNTIQGMAQLQEEFVAIRPELVLVGEGLNEISFQRQCFAQAHIHDGWGTLEGKHVEAAHPICSFLWEGQTRLIGYYHLSPSNEDFDLGIKVYEQMNALPTITTSSPGHLKNMSPGIKRILDRAKGTGQHPK